MQLKYGTYEFPNGQCAVRIAREFEHTDGGARKGYRETWTVNAWLTGANPAAITTALAALKAALVDGQNLILYLNDGTTPSNHQLLDSDCLGGVKVKSGPSFDSNDGGEYAVYRSFTITFEGYVQADAEEGGEEIMSWQETVEVSGGTARKVFQQPLTGPPIEQTVAERTPYMLVQSGRAVGKTGYPAANGQLHSTKLMDRSIVYTGPKRLASGEYSDYETSWRYTFGSATSISGTPTAWRNT